MSEPKLIKIDRNGSKHFEGRVKCDRCGGDGLYKWGAVINGNPQYVGTCFKCLGSGWVIDTWIERTPEYQAKLDAKKEAKRKASAEMYEKIQAELEAKEEAERKAKEEAKAAEEAKKAISQFVGTVGCKLESSAKYVGSPHFKRKSFGSYREETCYIHTFLDPNGNKIVWKTGRGLNLDEGQTVTINGTVKEHIEYRELLRKRTIRNDQFIDQNVKSH